MNITFIQEPIPELTIAGGTRIYHRHTNPADAAG